MNRGAQAYQMWREGNPEFDGIVEYVKGNKGRFEGEATERFRGKIAKVEMGVLRIAEKIVKWDELKSGEKGRVLRAVGLLVRMKEGEKGREGSTSYEDRLKKLREK